MNYKSKFPIFNRKINNQEIIYLDSAATSQKPQQVIDEISDFYQNYNSNIHRGIYPLSEEATTKFEDSRKNIADFINAQKKEEIIFTSGTTQSLNFCAQFLKQKIIKDETILVTEAEHHSNLIPWQVLAKETGANIIAVEIDEEGFIDKKDLIKKLKESNVKVLAFSHVSNVLGIKNDVKEIVKIAKENGALTVIDGAQAVGHLKVNVMDYGCDFYAFSAHKMYGPTGVGVLYINGELLEELEPVIYGGGMIEKVDIKNATWAKPPHKFEAGTPNIAAACGFSSAIDFINEIGLENIINYEENLTKYAMEKLTEIDGVKIIGTTNVKHKSGLISFVYKNYHPHDIASILSSDGVYVRAGSHCAHPIHKKYGIPATTRISFGIYNEEKDIDSLVLSLKKVEQILGE